MRSPPERIRRTTTIAALDYRYCWIRDAAMTVRALVSLGSTEEAEGYLRWLHGVLSQLAGPERLHPLYTVSGQQLGAEAGVDSLPGYAGSRPVRVGNLASHQDPPDGVGPGAERRDDPPVV